MREYYRVTDVKLDGKPTARTIYRVEGLSAGTESKDYQTRSPKVPPTPQQIQWLENDLGFKLTDECKQFIKQRGAVRYDDFNTIGVPESGRDYSLSISGSLDDIEEFSSSKETPIPKDAVPVIDNGSSGIVLYLNNSKSIGYWVNGSGFSKEGPATSLDEAMLQALLDSE